MAFDAATHLQTLSMHGPEIPLTPENRALVWAELYRRMGEPQTLEPKKSTEGEECGNL
jgi:hypothetical protein